MILLIGGACRTNASFAAVNYIIVVVVVYAIFVGLIGYFKEQREDAELFEKRALELRKKQYRMLRNRKIELLIYAFLNVGVTVAALLSKIMTVTFKSELADIPMYTLSGYRLLLKPGEFTSKNERIVGFIVFALLVICLTCAFLSLISFLSRSLYFNKIAVFSVIAARTLSRSLSVANAKPGMSGSKPFWTLLWPVAESVASVRPWKELRMQTIS